MSEKTGCMLTTNDNPFDPFTEFRQWFLYDVKAGYNTCGLIARVSPFNIDDLSPGEQDREMERTVNEIIKNYDVLGIYKKVYKQTS